MAKCSNVGAGKMEIILSIICWIYFKLTNFDEEELMAPEAESSRIF
jgi:hypothetical protein